jgi:two-component system, chemotaxis family, CheB/CheR fusion protein
MTNEVDTVRDPDPAQAPAASGEPPSHAFFIVGIGAAGGGLDAVVELTRNVPLDDMAFVVVQHQAPGDAAKTILPGRSSSVRVVTATDGMVVEPDCIHVIPPDVSATLSGGVLRVSPRDGEPQPLLPIDQFFRALARDQGPSAIGVILSGTGADGTLGLTAIREAGGLTFRQDDASLTPDAIGAELRRIAGEVTSLTSPDADALDELFALIRTTFGNDLAAYKRSTVERRLARRMRLRKLPDLATYVELVRADAIELGALYKDMLITVTSFFRDPIAYQALARQVLPRMLVLTAPNVPIRIWVPACSTGEEAYSIAIELVELLETAAADHRIRIFASDVDDASIRRARLGAYSADIELDVPPDRLRRYFVAVDGGYRICRRIRDLVTFSKHNVLADVPFSRMDLVSCRNLLIYLQPAAHQTLLEVLHYALAPDGSLLVGSSESVGDAPMLFAVLDRKAKLYTRRPDGTPAPGLVLTPTRPVGTRSTVMSRRRARLDTRTDRKVLDLLRPHGVAIDATAELLLRSTVQELEDTNEDLEATNEELESANEELQSANEELVASREELEATNEQVFVINHELQKRIAEVADAHDDLHNILAGVDHAVVVVDTELRIRRYTAAASRLFGLAPADCGRSIERVEHVVPGARAQVAEALATLHAIDVEILAGNQRWYRLRIAASRTHDDAPNGAVITLADIDVVRRVRDRSREVAAYADKFLEVIAYPLLVVDIALRVVWANAAYYARFQVIPEETLGNRLTSVAAWDGATPELVDQVQETLASGTSFRDHALRSLRIGASRIPLSVDPALALLSIEDRPSPGVR